MEGDTRVTQPTGLKAHPAAIFKKNGTCISGSSSYQVSALNIGTGRVKQDTAWKNSHVSNIAKRLQIILTRQAMYV
jgi:phosphotransferase system HPr-like phosphotransfer protein